MTSTGLKGDSDSCSAWGFLSKYPKLVGFVIEASVKAFSCPNLADYASSAAAYAAELASSAGISGDELRATILAAFTAPVLRLLQPGGGDAAAECARGALDASGVEDLLASLGVASSDAIMVGEVLRGTRRRLWGLVSDALSLAKMDCYGFAEFMCSRLCRKGGVAGSLLYTASRQLTFIANLEKAMCTSTGLRTARRLIRNLGYCLGALASRLWRHGIGVGVRVQDVEDGRLVMLYPKRCPLCGGRVEVRLSKAESIGRCKSGVRVVERCLSCGWKLSFRLCVPSCGKPLEQLPA